MYLLCQGWRKAWEAGAGLLLLAQFLPAPAGGRRPQRRELPALAFCQGAKMLDPYRELLSCVPISPEKPKGRAAHFSTGFGADSVL